MVDLIDAALIRGIETADAFDFIAKEIEPKPYLAARWEQINDTAADRKFAGIGNRIDAEIAV